jgi:proline iminopeptidase
MIEEHDGLAVYRFASGRPVFFMPGPHRFQRPGLRSADALIDGLARIGREVVTFDPPGSGRSTRSPRIGMAEMIACSDEALDVAGVATAVDAIGHSMGGFALLAYALERPERIGRLVLIGTGAGDYMSATGALWNGGHRAFRAMATLGILQTLWPRLAPEQLLRNLIERESFVDRRLARPERVRLVDWFRPKAGRTDWHGVARRLDYHARLREIHAPTLILCGRHDPQFPLACSRRLEEGIASSRLVVFDRTGHYPFIEEPDAFWAAVGRFLAPPIDLDAIATQAGAAS